MASESTTIETVKSATSALDGEQQKPATPVHLKPCQYVQSDLVAVFVGKERKTFRIYKDLLCAKSSFFASKLKDEWDAAKNEVYLEQEDPEAFAALVDWMFTDKMLAASIRTRVDVTKVCTVYKLADFLLMSEAKNSLVNQVLNDRRPRKKNFTFHGLKDVYDECGSETKLFQLIFRSSICHFMLRSKDADFPGLDDRLIQYPSLMLLILKGIREYQRQPWLPLHEEEDRCKYHDHADGSTCT